MHDHWVVAIAMLGDSQRRSANDPANFSGETYSCREPFTARTAIIFWTAVVTNLKTFQRKVLKIDKIRVNEWNASSARVRPGDRPAVPPRQSGDTGHVSAADLARETKDEAGRLSALQELLESEHASTSGRAAGGRAANAPASHGRPDRVSVQQGLHGQRPGSGVRSAGAAGKVVRPAFGQSWTGATDQRRRPATRASTAGATGSYAEMTGVIVSRWIGAKIRRDVRSAIRLAPVHPIRIAPRATRVSSPVTTPPRPCNTATVPPPPWPVGSKPTRTSEP